MLENIKVKIKDRLGVPSQSWSINNIKNCGFNPGVIGDVGAYEGSWTREVKNIFPDAKYFLFEAQESKREKLENYAASTGNVNFEIALLGAENNKEILFNEYETASSVLVEHFKTEAVVTKKMLYRLDEIIQKNNWPYPDFLKLDTQGYELEILKGAANVLKHVQVILMEVSFIDIYQEAPLIKDVINFMDEKDFQIYDICGLMRRPLDKALFQSDMLFVRKDSILISDKKWKS